MSERLLRYYEQQGLLHPERQPSGYRDFREGDVDAVRRIRTLLSAGLPTALIAEVLPCMRDDGQKLVPTCAEMLDDLNEARDRLSSVIGELTASRAVLDEVIAAAPRLAEPV